MHLLNVNVTLEREHLLTAFVTTIRIVATLSTLSSRNEILVEWSAEMLPLGLVAVFFFPLHRHANSPSARAMNLNVNDIFNITSWQTKTDMCLHGQVKLHKSM